MTTDLEVVNVALRPRYGSLDRVRGLAIALMIGDHVCDVLGGGLPYRLTFGRLAMPLFFILGGMLVRNIHVRHFQILGLGLAIPAFVPWIDEPNVLVWYVVGAILVRYARRARVLFVAFPLLLLANDFVLSTPGWYDPFALIGLMMFGTFLNPVSFQWGELLPRVFQTVGKYPVSIYIGHLLILEGLRWVI